MGRRAGVLVGVISLVLALAGCGDAGAGEPTPDGAAGRSPASGAPTERADEPAVLPDEWRVEVWRDVQVEVPASWGLGWAPVDQGGTTLWCAEEPGTAYVGRPGYGSDVCLEWDGRPPAQDFLWFGSPLDVGRTEVDGRRVVTTAVGGTRVSVGAAPELVDRVLASVRRVDVDEHGCPERPVDLRADWTDEGPGLPRTLSVCVYDEGARLWSTRLGRESAQGLVDLVDDRLRPGTESGCSGADRPPEVLLRVTSYDPFGTRPLLRDFEVRLGDCAQVDVVPAAFLGPTDGFLPLTPEVVATWTAGPAEDGVRTYVRAPAADQAVQGSFAPVPG